MRLSARLTRIVLEAGVCRDIYLSRSAVNGVTIERHPFHHAGRKIHADAQAFGQLSAKDWPRIAAGKDGRDSIAHHIRLACGQSDGVSLEILHVEFAGLPGTD